MVLDTEKCIVGIGNEIIYLKVNESIVLDALISNKYQGISMKELEEYIYPYTFNVYHTLFKLRKKFKKYLCIYTHCRRYYIEFTVGYINGRW